MTNRLLLPLAAAALLVPVTALAQSGAPAPQDQYEGVSRPPSDATIETSPDAPPAAAVAPKPAPGVPVAAPAPPQSGNPDDGMVTVAGTPAASVEPSQPAPTTPHLIARPENPDYGIVGVVPSPANQLAEGTNIRVRLLESMSTQTAQDGAPFRAQVAADVYKDGRVVIPVGSELHGRIVSVTQGHRFGTPATLRLRPERVTLPDGSSYHLFAQAVHVDGPGIRTDEEGGIQPTSRITKNLVEYGAATGGGAATGAVFGGPAGAAAGAIVGAGIITTHLLLQHPQQAHVSEGEEVTFSLTEPMELVATRN
jgi:hypothetical protein